ncbi:MAG: DUF5107 domain-containing protein [Ruminococcaceae bacterium]|nr:DUF5107 domain-containing protein [Oscillospiraceae bacterium]
MKLRLYTDVKDGAPLEGENPLPIFRDRQHHHTPKLVHESMKEQHRKLMGYECGNRFLPYRMQDRYGRKRAPMGLKSAVLENEHMRAVFYLEYGGRLTSLFDKDNNRELVHNNPVFQPGNLAIRDAWLSTGIEFNCSQFGHHFLTCEPLFAAKVVDENGEEFLRMYEYERCKGVFYQMDFHLPSGSRFLYLYTQIINPQDVPVSTYWWTNIDLPEKEGVRVFSATDEVIYYMSPEQMAKLPGYSNMAVGNIPYLDAVPGVDLSYPRNYSFATDYFFQIPETEPMPWEAAAYTDGFVMYEVSTSALRYHKMFCWGVSAGGQKWRDYLARPNEGDFFEIQAGLAPTQGHGYIMEPRETIEFVQAFGCLYCKPNEFQEPEWHEAQAAMEKKIHAEITSDQLYALQDRFRALAEKKPAELLHMGSGFGALELRRREKAGCPYDTKGMIFPEASMGPDQALWMSLLDEGRFPAAFPERIPAAYVVQKEWMELLEKALEDEANRNWNAWLHYGIMQAEEGDFDAAVKSFEKSLQCTENVWALRNIAYIYKLDNNIPMAMACYERLFKLPGAYSDQAFAEEYMSLLVKQRLYQQTWDFYRTLPENLQAKDRISLLAGSAAVEVGETAYVESLFKRDFAVIREGENSTSDIWFRYKARQVARERGVEYSDELLAEVKLTFDPPQEIDFRMGASQDKKRAKK